MAEKTCSTKRNTKEEPKEPQAKTETRTSRHKKEKDVMNDDMYRQVLQKFREGEKDDTVLQKKNVTL